MLELFFAGTIAIPEVVHHEQPVSMEHVAQICWTRVTEDQKPCAVVDIDGERCFAFLDFNGNSTTVHCFPTPDPEEK